MVDMSKDYIQLLHRRLDVIEESLCIEAKQVGLLYHVCTLDAYLKYIKPKDVLSASGGYTNHLYGGNEFVSFTRDQFFAVNTNAVNRSDVLVQLVIDGNKLSEKHKVAPYNDFAYDFKGNIVNNDKGVESQREKEEVVRGPIENISNYITEYRVDFRDLTEDTLNDLKSSGLIEKDAIYFPFAKNVYRSNDEIHAFIKQKNISLGEPLEFIIDFLEEYANQNSIVDDAFSHDEYKAYHVIGDLLINFDVNKNYPKYGYLLQHYMSFYEQGDSPIIAVILSRDADLFPESGMDFTALLFRMPLSQLDKDAAAIIGAMFRFSHLDPNHLVRGRDSLLSKAISMGMKETFDVILKQKKVNVNTQNSDGSTALFKAAESGDTYFTKALLKKGADPTIKNNNNWAAISIARPENKKLIQQALDKLNKKKVQNLV